jgi:Xaa-Pro aminopeptidase
MKKATGRWKLEIMNRFAEGPARKSAMKRLQKLRAAIGKKGLDALLISQPQNLLYLSGFTGSSGWLLISEQNAILATDFRYVEQAKEESPYFQILQIKREFRDWLPGLVSDFGLHSLGFEANFISYEGYNKLSETMKSGQVSLDLVPTIGIVDQLRSIKELEELQYITKAAELVDVAFEQAKAIISPGITEKEIAWEIEKFLRQKGSEGMPFEIIVASGPNSALPHARPTEKIIGSGEPVLIDMGAKINGYCSDFSRTLVFGKADESLHEIYNIVLEAQITAIERVESGMDASQADRLARSVIEQADYGDAFGHGLGHGVGLAVHEFPSLGPSSSDSLVDGMVFTIEPGIYLTGQGGVRIEDMVVMENGKARVLSKSKRDLLF